MGAVPETEEPADDNSGSSSARPVPDSDPCDRRAGRRAVSRFLSGEGNGQGLDVARLIIDAAVIGNKVRTGVLGLGYCMSKQEVVRGRAGEQTGYTVEELSRKVGMSPRNIRAHQARKLLPPPVRRGRVAYYQEAHVRRLETIKRLQREGFNLVSIEAILGANRADRVEPAGGSLEALVGRLAHDQPALLYALARHGVVGRGDDGVIRVARPRALHAALDLNRVGLPAGLAFRLLGELLDSTQVAVRHLVEAAGTRLLALRPNGSGGGLRSWAEAETDAAALTQGVVNVLVEVLRIAVENRAQTSVAELLADLGDLGFQAEGAEVIDNG